MPPGYEQMLQNIKEIDGSGHVRFVLLFGSVAEGRARGDSDIDLCISYDGTKEEAMEFRFRAITALSGTPADIRIFEALPLYMRLQALRGVALFCSDTDELYSAAWDTIRDFESFRHRLDDYIGLRAMS